MYSFWSGEVQGMQEIAIESFEKDATFTNAKRALLAVIATRMDFAYYKKHGLVDGDLLPFDWRLVRNLFAGMRNSIRI